MHNRRSLSRGKRATAVILAMVLVASVASPALAHEKSKKKEKGFLTEEPLFITLADGLGKKAYAKALLSSGDMVGDFMFEGLPDGMGIRPGPYNKTVDVYVAHEQTTVPFFGSSDFQDASVSKLTLSSRKGRHRGAVLDASVALSPDDGFLRFCSASIAGPEEGLDSHVFFTGEETNDIVDGVQHGFAVVLDTDTGKSTAVPGLGRLNHENTVVIPDYDDLVMLTTDDTFNAPSSQLYMYIAEDQDALFDDEGSLWALRITEDNGSSVNPADPFNGANDYLDLAVGDEFAGEFIPVPRHIALGDQTVLENWSNANNVFQAIRLEDLAADKKKDGVVYIADTGRTRIVPDASTGRLMRGPGGTVGMADNGRIFKLVLDDDDPTVVESLTVLADGDAVGTDAYVPFTNPDNVDTSKKSLMVQEDTGNAKIWQFNLKKGKKGKPGAWRVVATVNDPSGESSGIVDASEWFGKGTWLLDVQGHGTNIDQQVVDGITLKRESGQLILMKIPGS
jgi:hypothetical protein